MLKRKSANRITSRNYINTYFCTLAIIRDGRLNGELDGGQVKKVLIKLVLFFRGQQLPVDQVGRLDNNNQLKTMTKQRANTLIFCLCIPGLVMAFLFLKNAMSGNNNISITVSESKKEINISADFPDEKSKRVQDFLRNKLKMVDLNDLTYLEIEHYSTPDRLMRFYIKSRPGSVELSMNKEENDIQAYQRMKETGEEIKEVLTN